ncbi:M1 family metallopeptidase [Yeosuana sp.]|uniref:M1 family metallopeptidase n=1 Tax=Yeosuana sp. TaxID=2529388 RepID=UPI00405506FC
MNSFKRIFVLLFVFGTILTVYSQNHQDRFEKIDVIHYNFNLVLSDEADEINGIADIEIEFKKDLTNFSLDLVDKQSDNSGMVVLSVLENEKPVSFQQKNNQLSINIGLTQVDEIRTYQIKYKGIPSDGLIISKNKYGERTFFGDNWPDRAKNWLPVVDHPSDKATVTWVVTAPSYYQVIGNGLMTERTNLSDANTLTRWQFDEPIPTKVMVIGVARFAVQNLDEIYNIPVSSWVYPQDKINGFKDYALALPILDFMINHVGTYPFKKLANVQSKTLFGGMENAGNIFYNENSITGNGDNEAVIAHEIAHQWFGDSASELDWHHVWLSEGFATYFENLFYENKYGRDSFIDKLKQDRQKALNYAKQNHSPIIDITENDYFKLLNPNTYEKASWVLHMLRRELGDPLFWKSIKKYYNHYKYSNALSEDFQRDVEIFSSKDLTYFFKQWLYQSGHPKLEVKWNNKIGMLNIEVNQTQKNIFILPLDVKINYKDGNSSIETLQISEKKQSISIPSLNTIVSIELDPNTWLFYELISIKKD